MVAPLIAAAAASAAANYYTSQQAQKANQREIDAMRDRINGVQSPNLNPEDFQYNPLDPNMLNYSQYQYGGDYTPDRSEYVQEKDPTLIALSQEGKFGKDAQLEALKKYRSNIASGYDPEFAAKLDQSSQRSQGDAQSRMASILQDAERRGQLGSNAMLSRQMQGSSDALTRGALTSQQAAVEAYKNQLQQQRDAANLGGQIAGEDQSLQAQNAGITNSFNQRTSRSYQQYLDQQNEMANQANLRNLNSKQQIGNQNVDTRNRQVADQYKAQQAERGYKNQIAGQRQGVQEQNFNNAMSRATGQNNIGNAQIGMNNQGAQNQINAIQGIGQGVGGYYQNQEMNDQRTQDREFQANQRQLDRDAYSQNGTGYTDYRANRGTTYG